MNKNICIVHFNTPVLTAHLVKSINKHTPGTNIYIFDNSDKSPFINTFNNVIVFDNTRGQIINFDQWLKKYPNKEKSGGKANRWGSAKHAYSVEKCMEMIKEPFVLFDSDVLVKKDFTPLFDEIVCYNGEVTYQPNSKVKRVLPFICFINTPLCIKNGIHYFDENYMHGLRVGPTGDRYDTGAAIYLLTEKKKAPHREIKVSDYIVHYGNGSWAGAAEKIKKLKHMPVAEWLEKHKNLWSDSEKMPISGLPFENFFKHIYCLHFLPLENRSQKLKEELRRVGIDENANYFSWVYDYPTQLLDLVYNDKRTNMDVALKSTSREFAKRKSLKHYEILKDAYSSGYDRILILEDDIRFHNDIEYIDKMLSNMPDTDVVLFDKMVSSEPNEALKYKRYIKTLPENSLYGNIKDSGVFFIFSSCYSVNRKAMKRIIELYENSLLPSDTPLNDKELSGSFAINNLAIQDPKFKTRKNETYDNIGLDVNAYNTIKTNPEMQVIPKQLPPAAVLGKKNKDSQTSNTKPHQVVFKMPTKPQEKKKIEPAPVTKTQPATQKTALPKKKQATHTRTINGKMSGFNKLYDIWA